MPTVTVYVLRSRRIRRRYVGITNDLKRRMAEHRTPSTWVHRLLGDFDLLLQEPWPNHRAARARERFLKSGKGREFLDALFDRGPGSATGG